MKSRGGQSRSNFLHRWLSSDAAMFAILLVLLCVILIYFYFAVTFKYFD